MITLSQTQEGAIAYFIPNAIGCKTELTPVGEANNWECVDDPRLTPDDDVTYVESHATDLKYDLYKLPNHTTEAGIINYIKVYSRAKSDTYAQDETGLYKIILTDNACANIYKSNDIDIATGYSTYSNIWLVNPRTSIAWTWNDMDNLQIGSECSSPTVSGAEKTLTIRPNGIGDVTDLPRSGCTENWQCVDDIISDAFLTYVIGVVKSRDLYEFDNHTIEMGDITGVSIFINVNPEDRTDRCFSTLIKTHGVEYASESCDLPLNTWTLLSTFYALNPNTSAMWTWAEIDNLQAGLYTETFWGTCTQVYVIIYYKEDTNPQIRTTQQYVEVNYDAEVDCLLQNPEEVSQDQGQAIKMLNFWSGNRTVYGISRTNKTVVMRGKEWDDSGAGIDACTRMRCVRNMGKFGKKILISGVGWLFDKEYRIISFGWKKVSDVPKVFEWLIELERTK